MTVGEQKLVQRRRTGRIIERPRLIKKLDETDAPVILLVAPAGYGKTTLARQWAKTLSGVIWVSCTPSHRDVVTFAEDVAAGIDALGGNASRFIGEYMRARSNPQRAAREIAKALADRAKDVPLQWLIIDDYQELTESPEAEEMVAVLLAELPTRALIASRTKPAWASARDVIYGNNAEIGAIELALTPEEAVQVLGRRPDLDGLLAEARGWPALIALASGLGRAEAAPTGMTETLHRYVAEELFRSASSDLQEDLIVLALIPRVDHQRMLRQFGDRAAAVVQGARDLGFLSWHEPAELHPLLLEFLLTKLSEDPSANERVRDAIGNALADEEWDHALRLVLHFSLVDQIDTVIQQAYRPLVRSGRVGTLSEFGRAIRRAPGFPPPVVDLVEAEVGLRTGEFKLAIDLARRAQKRLPADHPLLTRAFAIEGQCQVFYAAYEEASLAFSRAREAARDEADEAQAVHGDVAARLYGELASPDAEVDLLLSRRHESPWNVALATVAYLTARRYGPGLRGELHLDEALHALDDVEEPRTRSSVLYQGCCLYVLKAKYHDALPLHERFEREVREFDLDFAVPFMGWTGAMTNLGLKRLGDADRYMQVVEDVAVSAQQRHHVLNARILRARLFLQSGDPKRALASVNPSIDDLVVPRSWRAEYLATRALALACIGDGPAATTLAKEASNMTADKFAQMCAMSALAAGSALSQVSDSALAELLAIGTQTEIWDPVLLAARGSEALLAALAGNPEGIETVVDLAARSGDHALGKRVGVRTRVTRPPGEVLSPRELEVLGLMAQGRRNREIATALFIAESTVKVHVRHIFERLGVRSRAEAVARYERLRRSPER
jgi:DNA-binding NarL/FixJ family response regulator